MKNCLKVLVSSVNLHGFAVDTMCKKDQGVLFAYMKLRVFSFTKRILVQGVVYFAAWSQLSKQIRREISHVSNFASDIGPTQWN